MAGSNKTAAGGNKWMFGGFLDEFGYLVGATPSAPSAGATGSAMFNLVGVKSASPAVPERETIQITGDDELIGEIPLTSLASRRFTADIATQDLQQEAYMQGTNVQTVGEILLGVLDSVNEAEYDMTFILQSRALKQDTAVKGKKAWNGVIIPLAAGKPLGRRAFEERAAASFGLDITPQQAGYHPWGLTILDANAGTTGARFFPFSSEYPIIMERFTGNGVLSTFTLSKTPVSAAKTSVWVRRVLATTSSVNTSTPSFTVSAVVASGAEIVVVYEFQP